MIKRNLLKATIITTVIATLLCTAGCGKKSTNNNAATQPIATVSTETKSVAAKELTKTSLVTFDYTDAAGTTYTLEGKAVANESGDATIEVTDAKGNKVTFTGKATTTDGKMSVSGITVKDAGTLEKPDGSKIEVTTGAIVADASESTEGEKAGDIAVSEEVRKVETAKKEEAVIEAAREEVTNAQESINEENKNNDTIIADNGNNGDSDVSEGGKTEDNNTPEPEPVQPADPAPAPADPTPVEPDPEPSPEPVETPTEAPTEATNYVDGPNGPMYGADYEVKGMRGQDVNQGADKECPYPLKTVTTRYFYYNGSFSVKSGYYYVAINGERLEANTLFEELAYNLGKYNNTRRKIGNYSCGSVCFCAFDD